MAKRATKRSLSKKLSELSRQLQDDGEDGDGQETASASRHASGKGIVAVDEMQRDAAGNYDWFRDLLKGTQETHGFPLNR